jgi:hypothetical protein
MLASSEDYCRGQQGTYGRNWRRFLADNPALYTWFNDRVTSTFLCPWRTPSGKKLKDLNTATSGSLCTSAGKLISKMIEHHEATLLVVASKRGPYLLNE